MRIPAKAIPKFNGLKQRISGDADNKELRQAILDALPEAVEQTKDLAPYFRTTSDRETAKKIFDFLKKRVKYKADDYKQVIQLPSAILRPGAIADCKSLSLFTAAILQNLGIPWHFVLASYSDSTIPGHIYVQTDGGIIIDVVWGKFNSEKKPNYRYVMKNSNTFKKMNSNKIVGLGATEGAQEWAIRNGVWYSYSPSERIAIGVKKVTPIIAAARGIILTAISSNSGGLASMLKQLDIESTAETKKFLKEQYDKDKAAGLKVDLKTAFGISMPLSKYFITQKNPEFKQSSFDKKRDIELEWLQVGGNPNEFYEAYEKGKDKQPRGKYFAELLKRKANGASINPAQWIAGMANALFGKKYTPQQGIGEPVATTTTTVGTSASWIPVLQKIVAALGTSIVTAIVSRVAAGPREPMENEIKMAETDTTVTLDDPDLKPKTNYTPYIIGGVVIAGLAAIYLTQKKKK